MAFPDSVPNRASPTAASAPDPGSTSAALVERIGSTTAVVGVVGLGYVGLSEAVELARAGFRVVGFEIDAERIAAVRAGRSYLVDVTGAQVRAQVEAGRLAATADTGRLADMDVVLICVPTPLGKTKAPDLTYVVNATQAIAAALRPGQLIVLESTTYPGTTSEILLTALQGSGLRVGQDFHLCFSPERLNPGDRRHPSTAIPRVVGGVTRACAEVAARLYRRIAPEVVIVSSPEAAEMAKLLENTFRAVNIGLANEVALMCRALGIDVWEVIDAAASKPFGFMPFYPGPGLGGHCIPIDPLYLSWKARTNGFEPRFIDLAHQINSAMPRAVVSIVIDTLNARARSVWGARILVLGVAYKRDVNDTRESPALEILGALARRGAVLSYHDPYVPQLQVGDRTLTSVDPDEATLRALDCALILTDHTVVDYKRIVQHAPVVIDTRNATAGLVGAGGQVVRL
ncbi:MAG TPA: nucleotide sugar dehydrogenase [Candidatus Tectomicrobia bacterium]|nr:nucleotide sugar dehydrogenase [Candidatus Tectomicrobia bacterium]